MWIIRFFVKIIVLPLLLVVDVATLVTKISIFVGCYVVGAAVWLCGICCVIAIFLKMYSHAIVFAVVLGLMFLCLFAAANVQLLLESFHGVLKKI